MKRWLVAEKTSHDIIEQLLINRGISAKDRDSFLNPDYNDLYDPFLLKGMNKAVERILKAIDNNETIGIFSDFDADGIAGGAILGNLFNHLNVKNEVYIPSRDEGYGLNEAGILDLHEKGCKLIISVDLGITGKSEVEFAKSLSIDVIITDHHIIQEEKVPTKAYVIIHPKLSPKYPNKDLAGGGVAWKLAQALATRIKTNNGELSRIQNFPKWTLDLAAISTICDMVPLVGENRIIAKYGLKVLTKTKNLGLSSILKEAAIDTSKINTYTIGFQIGPRINAPGRLEHGQISYFLLTTRNQGEATKYAKKLNEVNLQRQDELARVLAEAKLAIKVKELDKNKIILLFDENWPDGVLGLVAGRITEELSRPTLVFTRLNDTQFKGSARSIKSFHILKALDKVKDLLVKYGGHSGAAGLTIKEKDFTKLSTKLYKIAQDEISDEDLLPPIKIDAEVAPPQVNQRLLEQIKKFEPFGMGNPRPVFMSKRLAISDLQLVGKNGKHLKIKLKTKNEKLKIIDGIIFNCAEYIKDLKKSDVCDIVYSIEENEWNGNKSIQLNIIDIKISKEV
ncbi:MAG: hypothetical protein ACD_58C00093G0006 [uncultured bacterium]|nr:MAG: hypothetical protein ACD_58C00093G0006 [uncultured bacterium]